MAPIGANAIDDIVGQAERLRPRTVPAARALGGLLDPIVSSPLPASVKEDSSSLYRELNLTIGRTIEDSDTRAARRRRFRITNSDRSIGAHLSGEMLRHAGPPADAPVEY